MSERVADTHVEPTGYVDLVNRGLGGQLREVVDPNGGREIRLDPNASPGAVAFYEASFLPEDLQYPERFDVGGDGSARLLRGFRRRPLPYAESARWKGTVTFRDSADYPVLRSRAGQEVRFRVGAQSRAPQVLEAGRRASVEGDRFEWRLGGDAAFSAVAVPEPGGSLGVAFLRPEAAAGTLEQNGDRPSGRGAMRSLLPGDWLVLRNPGLVDVYFLERGTSGVISEIRRTRSGPVRIEPEGTGLEWTGRAIASVMDRVVGFLAEAGTRNPGAPAAEDRALIEERDVHLTFDAGIQDAAVHLLHETLHANFNPHIGWTTSAGLPRPPPRAAVAVLDYRNGDLLGGASYPDAAQLDEHLSALERQARLLAGSQRYLMEYAIRETRRRRDAYTRNHVFDDHQIGSTVKPLFSAAVALAWRPASGRPDPLSITIDCTGSLAPADGTPAEVPGTGVAVAYYQDEPHGRVDFEGFLARSCHAFMFRLGAEALLGTPGYNAEVCPDHLSGLLAGAWASRPTTPDAARSLAPIARFAWLSGGWAKDPESDRWNTQWWRPLDDEIAEAVEVRLGCPLSRSLSLAPISPSWVNLDVSSLTHCHPHYSSFLKGGATNRWSGADLAVAYARLVTGREMAGRTVLADENEGGEAASGEAASGSDCMAFLGCDDPDRYVAVRDSVLRGMGRGFTEGTSRGAAGGVMPILQELEAATGRQWGAYGKTGTSDRQDDLARSVNASLRVTATASVTFKEVNYVLILAECGEGSAGGGARPGLGCAVPPPVGGGARGLVMHFWAADAPGLDQGADVARVLAGPTGRAFLDRLVGFVRDHP